MSSAEIEQRLARLEDFWPVLLGAGIGGLAAYALTSMFRGFEPSVYAWLTVVAIAVVMIVLIIWPGNWRVRTTAVVAIFAYAAGLAYITRDPRIVIERAEAIAGSKPYCIQVAESGADYRTATAKADFTSLTMRAPGTFRSYQFHAVMAVGAPGAFDFYNWSHRNHDWMPLNTNGDFRTPVIRCQPRAHFVKALPLFRLTRGDGQGPIYISNHAFVIPPEYKPQFSLSGAANVMFVAHAPDFQPVPECTELRLCVFDMVQVYLRPEPLKIWFERNARTRVQEGSYESGAATRIQCPDLEPHPNSFCAHDFLVDGVLIHFNYPERDIPKWREMQAKVLALFRSFEVSAKR